MKVALVGNPNTGKSSIFNALTGLDQQIGNYPGVTVERKVGHMDLGDGRLAGREGLAKRCRQVVLVFFHLVSLSKPNMPA